MSRESLLIILGIVIALCPFIGLPLWLLSIMLPLLGLAIVAFAFAYRARVKRTQRIVPRTSYETADA